MFSDGGDTQTGWPPLPQYRLANTHVCIMTDPVQLTDSCQQAPTASNEFAVQTTQVEYSTASTDRLELNKTNGSDQLLSAFLRLAESMISEALMENLSSQVDYSLIDMRSHLLNNSDDSTMTTYQSSQRSMLIPLRVGPFKPIDLPPSQPSGAVDNKSSTNQSFSGVTTIQDVDSEGWLLAIAYGVDSHPHGWCDHSNGLARVMVWDRIRQRPHFTATVDCCLTKIRVVDEQVFAGTFHGSLLKWDSQGRMQQTPPATNNAIMKSSNNSNNSSISNNSYNNNNNNNMGNLNTAEPVRALLPLPTGQQQPTRIAVVGGDGVITVYSISNLSVLQQFSVGEGLTAAALWPSQLQQDLLVGTENGSLYRLTGVLTSTNTAVAGGMNNTGDLPVIQERSKTRFTVDKLKRTAHTGPITMISSCIINATTNANTNANTNTNANANSGNGILFATAADDGTVKIWGMQTTPLRVLRFTNVVGMDWLMDSNSAAVCLWIADQAEDNKAADHSINGDNNSTSTVVKLRIVSGSKVGDNYQCDTINCRAIKTEAVDRLWAGRTAQQRKQTMGDLYALSSGGAILMRASFAIQ